MSYNIDKNTRLYYVWTIRYDKYLCRWSNLSSSTTSTNGRDEWVATTNYRFLVMTYHKRTANDSTQPDLPSDLNYPGYPPQKYVSMEYIKWRTVKSSSYIGAPTQLSFITSSGDDLWRQVTPFEYEMTQSVPMFCATIPQIPSFTNTVLKYDDTDVYRKFRARWACNSSGVLTYVSGPTYINSVKERGNGRWEYEGKTYADSVLGTVYEIIWVSYEAGIGTSPNKVISEDLRTQLSSYCETQSSSTDTSLEASDVSLTRRTFDEETYSGYPVYRVEYTCATKTFGDVELIALDQDDKQKRTNAWEYIDLYTELSINKCVFYYYSSGYQTDITNEEAAALTKPTTTNIKLYECPCSWLIDVDQVLEATEFITLIISGLEGRASSRNSVYKLSKIEGENSWKLEDSSREIVLKYTSDTWDFSLSDNYKDNNYLRIDKEIAITSSFIGNFRIVFSESADFSDEDGVGTCMLSFEGNTLEDYVAPVGAATSSTTTDDDSSSSSSSSSSSENDDVVEGATTPDVYIYEDFYGPEAEEPIEMPEV